MANEILLEAGTNEMELLVFRIGNTPFGINVAKVREIVQRQKSINIPYSPAAVEGSFRLRDRVLTLVNVGQFFGMECNGGQTGNGMIIVVEFNSVTCGILVDSVERIYRLKWDRIEAPSQYLISMSTPITGVAKVSDMIVQIIDFETILAEILGISSAGDVDDDYEDMTQFHEARIILVDDSSLIRTRLVTILEKAGYSNLTVCTDGQEAWDLIQSGTSDSEVPFDLVLTDVEMPRMDGLHLTSRIKEDARLSKIPVILFSSLITESNRKKGESVGADAQVSKPNSKEMIGIIEELLKKTMTGKEALAVS